MLVEAIKRKDKVKHIYVNKYGERISEYIPFKSKIYTPDPDGDFKDVEGVIKLC